MKTAWKGLSFIAFNWILYSTHTSNSFKTKAVNIMKYQFIFDLTENITLLRGIRSMQNRGADMSKVFCPFRYILLFFNGVHPLRHDAFIAKPTAVHYGNCQIVLLNINQR